jgi:MFS family permease
MLLALVLVQVQLPTSTGFGLGASLTTAGLLLTPYAVATVLGSRLSARVGRRVGPDLVLPMGAAVYGASGVFYVFAHDSVAAVVVVMVLGGLGSGFTFASMPGLILRETPQHETGSVMAFNVLLRFLGFSIGGTLAATCLTSFSGTGEPDLTGFLVTAWTAAGLWIATAVVCLALIAARRR